MATGYQDISGSFPPRATIAGALLSTAVSALNKGSDSGEGGRASFDAGPSASVGQSSRLGLVAGFTQAGNAAKLADAQAEKLRAELTELQNNVSALENDRLSDADRRRVNEDIRANLKELDKLIDSAKIGNINLLDGSDAQGIRLNLDTGDVTNVSIAGKQNIAGRDQSFDYNPREIVFQVTDLRAALQDLQDLEVSTFPDTAAADATTSNQYSLQRFQSVINQASTALTDFKKQLAQAASENISVRDDRLGGTIGSAEQARQVAQRIAQQLQQESYTISAAPRAVYFSLFA